MTKQIPAGKVVKTALISIEIEIDASSEEGYPLLRFGIDGTPRLTFLDIVEDASGRHIPQRRTVGPDNVQEVDAIYTAYIALTTAWQGKLDAQY